jgi:lipopolysaccharide export system protein LptC
MKNLIFVIILTIFLPILLKAQDNVQDNIKKEVNNYLTKEAYSMQELNTKLLDEYGIKNIEFVKLENGKYIPVKENQVKKFDGKDIEETQISSDVILIFAIIGAVLVALLILRSI